MFFRQYYLGCLSHASYLVGDTSTGRAAVVDPQRDVQHYLDDAATNGLHITHVVETHFHADFLSGHLELAAATGARIVFGAAAAGRTEFEIEAMGDGDTIALGDPHTGVVLEIRETPGHTPESICIVVHEHGVGPVPYGVLTGDTLFIGDVGRPDLLAAVGHTADGLARQLYHSLHERLLTLPDSTRVYPAHGAGSACGKHLSTDTESTIGEQRRTNYALRPMSEDDFVAAVTEGQAAAPMYFLSAATKNRQARSVDVDTAVPVLDVDAALAALAAGAVAIDTRDDIDFAAAHLRGSVNVGLGGRFAEYAGEVVEPGTPIVVVADRERADEAVVRLRRIGFDEVVGILADPQAVLVDRPDLAERASRLTAADFEASRRGPGELQIVDVRGPGETALGTVPDAHVIQLPQLLSRLHELQPTTPTVVYCAGGYRSSIAASLLRSKGFTDVSDVLGGYTSWAAGQPGAPDSDAAKPVSK